MHDDKEYHFIPFQRGAPSAAQLHQALRERSGLEVELIGLLEGGWLFLHKNFTLEIEFCAHEAGSADKDRVRKFGEIGIIQQYPGTYLYWCTLAAMRDLGGDVPFGLPKWVNTKWNERKWWQFIPKD